MRTMLFLLAGLGYLYVPCKQALHIFQQNHYQLDRYSTWLKEQSIYGIRKQFWQWLSLLAMWILWIVPSTAHPCDLLTIVLLIYAYLSYRKEKSVSYVQPLTYTHRAKRLQLVHLCLLWLLLWLLYRGLNFHVLLLLIPCCYGLPWFSLLVAAMICEPLEEAIKASYVKDAKAQLRQHKDLIKIGITGSYGKTSVKNILHTILSEHYYTYMTPHSYNNLMGLTISIRTQLKKTHQIFLAEMGADHVKEIERLAAFIEPSLAIVTAVGLQHIATFGSQEAILQEKMKLVEALPQDGIAILNYDNAYIRNYQILHPCKVIRYGIHNEDVDVRATHISYSPKGSHFIIHMKEQEIEVDTILLGEHNVLNILAAVAAAVALHVSPEEIVHALKGLRYVEHRLEVRNMGGYTLLDDAYNSNPIGAGYALDVLAQMPNHRFLLTPGFLDLGKEKQAAHEAYAHHMVHCADTIILIGKTQTDDIYETLCKEHFPMEHLYRCTSTKAAFQLLSQLAKTQDCALIENDLPDAFNH